MRQVTPAITLHQVRHLAFGPGCSRMLAGYLGTQAARSVLLITSPPLIPLVSPLLAPLTEAGIRCTVWSQIRKEPDSEDLRQALEAAREVKADTLIGLGGGSAMDVAKLAAALADGTQRLEEVYGIDCLKRRSTALICLPTTSGTGSEVSPIAIVMDTAGGLKKGVLSPHLVPDAAFVDPELALSVPPAITAATGADALTHCIEAYANLGAHPLVDTWALEGIRLIATHLQRAVEQGGDLEARTALAQASLYGGLCLGPVNTAAVHALAYPLGSQFNVAHGLSNAVLLPTVLDFNLSAAPQRYADIALALGAIADPNPLITAQRGVQRIRALLQACQLPIHLRELGIPMEALPGMARAALSVTRLLSRNPRPVTEQDALALYRTAY